MIMPKSQMGLIALEKAQAGFNGDKIERVNMPGVPMNRYQRRRLERARRRMPEDILTLHAEG